MNQCGAVMRNLPESGVYTLVVRPEAATTQSYSARVWLSSELDLDLTVNQPQTLATPRPGQIASLWFDGTAGQLLQLGVSGIALVPNGTSFEFVAVRPDGGCLSQGCPVLNAHASHVFTLPSLPADGRYHFQVEHWNNGWRSVTGSSTVSLETQP